MARQCSFMICMLQVLLLVIFSWELLWNFGYANSSLDPARLDFGFWIAFWTPFGLRTLLAPDLCLTVPWTMLWTYLGMYCNRTNFTFALNL